MPSPSLVQIDEQRGSEPPGAAIANIDDNLLSGGA